MLISWYTDNGPEQGFRRWLGHMDLTRSLVPSMEKAKRKGNNTVCEQALQGALAAGREKEGELATTSLEFEFHLQFPCGSQLNELSDFRQSARNENEH